MRLIRKERLPQTERGGGGGNALNVLNELHDGVQRWKTFFLNRICGIGERKDDRGHPRFTCCGEISLKLCFEYRMEHVLQWIYLYIHGREWICECLLSLESFPQIKLISVDGIFNLILFLLFCFRMNCASTLGEAKVDGSLDDVLQRWKVTETFFDFQLLIPQKWKPNDFVQIVFIRFLKRDYRIILSKKLGNESYSFSCKVGEQIR